MLVAGLRIYLFGYLNLAEKQALETALVADGISILMERVIGANSQYGVPINRANVFHCTN